MSKVITQKPFYVKQPKKCNKVDSLREHLLSVVTQVIVEMPDGTGKYTWAQAMLSVLEIGPYINRMVFKVIWLKDQLHHGR